jgi:ABC-type glycerol-3-phosphate transport system substrate-binding protein
MRMHNMVTGVAVLLTVAMSTGCGKPPATAADDGKPPKSTLTVFAEGVTGKTAVDAGRRAQKTIEQVSAKHSSDLDAVLETKP